MNSQLPILGQNRFLALPAFFPDATQGVVRTLDNQDVENTRTFGLLVNTYHLYRHFGQKITPFTSVRELMSWKGATISDSGGFQIMSIIHKTKQGKITDEGAWFKPENSPELLFTPELSIKIQ
ncbi:queuine tRNA-ribosyltransferase family protein, partial [Patescibacteria group bacterium]|nr:queuine tRNA-ribosyltransferase family protein [Patescibacteria group bacterium]